MRLFFLQLSTAEVRGDRDLPLRTMESGIISNVKSTFRNARYNRHAFRVIFVAMRRAIIGAALLCTAASSIATPASMPVEGDYCLAASKLYYPTLGAPAHDETGLITNVVLLLDGAGTDAKFSF